MLTDAFAGRADISSQGETWLAITPSDTADLPAYPKAIWVSVAGAIALVGSDNHAETFTVPQGLLYLRPRKVLATGTTATGIVGIY